MAATDARPFPIKNTAYRVYFPILDADGDTVTGATGLDSEASLDGGTFADCTNEATEIATSSGIYYLDLTASEMNTDCTVIQVKTTSTGAKTTVITLYPVDTGDIDVDVTAFGGTAGTFSSGRPEVNATHWGGTAVASANVRADLRQIIGTTITEGGSGRAAGSFSTMHNVASPVLTTASVNQTGDNYARLGAPSGASLSADVAAVKVDTGTLLTRITSTLFTGITSLAEWLGLIAGKQTGNTTARTEIRATGGGSGTFDETTDSIEAIRDRGDAAWVTGGGGGGTDWTADERTAIRTILGVPASGTTPDVPTAGALKVIDDYIDTEIATLSTNLSALITTIGTAGDGLTGIPKTGYKLASDGLDLIIPADPSAIPVLGTATLPQWIAYFGAWSVNEVNSDADSVDLRNSADNANLATHAVSDDGTTFSSAEPT